MTATPAPSPEFSDTTLSKAADLTVQSYRSVWTGPSGEESTGEAVARHLEATIALLNKDGWIRVQDFNATPSLVDLPDDDSMTVKAMLRSLLHFVREESRTDQRRTMYSALHIVGRGGRDGDTDTGTIAGEVLDLLVRALTGSDSARATPWSERQHRTLVDITALLTAGARFARLYGPGSASVARPRSTSA